MIKRQFKSFLEEIECFNFQIILFVAIRKYLNNDVIKNLTNYFSFNAELIINGLNIDKNLELSYQMIMLIIQKYLRKRSELLTKPVDSPDIYIYSLLPILHQECYA